MSGKLNNEKGILLESGTNELEIIEFIVGQSNFGINVIKVREIVEQTPLTKIPKSHPSIEGLFKLRNNIIPVVDLATVLGYAPSENPKKDRFIVSEFNQLKVAFHVHDVSRIHRVSWGQIEQPSEIYQIENSAVIGIIKMDDRVILLLDYEKIVSDISPQTGIGTISHELQNVKERSQKSILIADDSPTLRNFIKTILTEAGYSNLNFYNNGSLAWDYLEGLAADLGERLTEQIQLVITDIEMPKMDGHHLTKRIKEHPILKKMPVIIFSSLITDDLLHKGEQVGADAQISKPQYPQLVKTIDRLLFE